MRNLPLLLPLLLLVSACSRPPSSADVAAADAAVATPQPAAEAAAEPPGDPERPRLRVETLDDGVFDLAEQRGNWVVVNFWATWCKPCIKEIPDLSAFDASRDDVRVIGLAYEEIALPDLRAFLARHPASYPIAVLDVYAPPADFDTPRGLPMTYLIDPEGKVARKFLGPITSVELAAAIASAVAEAG